ncbi:MAG: alpha/beta hydrolase [Pirellulales bacterium]|nr:alpha/beta hydrolase [Pirellulales bacterium]
MFKTARGNIRIAGFRSPEMDYQLLRTIGKADAAASVGQCLYAAENVDDGCAADWTGIFSGMAENARRGAEERLAAGHIVSARDLYLQASEYNRTAEYYGDPRSFDHHDLGVRASECFQKFVGLLEEPARFVEIPYADSFLPAYFFAPCGEEKPRNTVLAMNGFDGTSEELYATIGQYALERDLNVLLFDGPGQVGTLRLNSDLKFRPDYEVPVGAVLDYICNRPDVNREKIALVGRGQGGYFAARAAAFDSRIKALVTNSPIVNLFRYKAGLIGGEERLAEFLVSNDFVLEEIDKMPPGSIDDELHWVIANCCFRFGKKSFGEVNDYLKQFVLTADVLEKITCPCLAIVGESEGDEPIRQTEEFCNLVAGPVTKRIFTDVEGAGSHCQAGNYRLAASVMLDWVNDVFNTQHADENAEVAPKVGASAYLT